MSDSFDSDAHVREEWQRVRERRSKAFQLPEPETDAACSRNEEPEDQVGLALSGGGLRSAMFNDGFLQGLSHSGLLRYVDYLCSVSGGGYIAAHLATRAKRNSKAGFHDDVESENSPPRWALGRSPQSGEVDKERMRGVGRYLASKVALAPSFLWSLALSAFVYVGLVGVVATLLALFWRSFDDPIFRALLRNVLDFKFGGELAIAFYPAGIVLIGWLLLCVFGWFRRSNSQRSLNQAGLMLLLAAIAVSAAVFIGNGKTNASRGGTAVIELNHYAQWLAIAAAGLQLFAFIGRDKLFRSERDESHYWQKALQKFCTTGVIAFACFAMVHWMAREDISGYTSHRSPHLVVGDVYDWQLLAALQKDFENSEVGEDSQTNQSDQDKPANDYSSYFNFNRDINDSTFNLSDGWNQHQSVHPLITLRDGEWNYLESNPPRTEAPREIQSWNFWQRLRGAVVAYGYSLQTPNLSKAELVAPKDLHSIHDFYVQLHLRRQLQTDFLKEFNVHMEDENFTKYLLGKNPKHETKFSNADGKTVTLREIEPALSKEQRPEIIPAISSDPTTELMRRNTVAGTNRKLLAAVYPGVIQNLSVASTLVVPPYDQAARWRWLVLWWTIFCVGICMSAFRNQSSTIYTYYRDRLSTLFLDNDDNQGCRGTTPLSELRPTRDGLPHPLFLASRMTPSVVEESYSVQNAPFVFSPVYCGDREGESFRTTHVGLPGVGHRPIAIGDAVTISGAAVTPLMTENRSLSIVLSFFGDGLGQWLIRRNPNRYGRGLQSLRAMPIAGTVACLAIIAALSIGWYYQGFSFSIALIIALSLVAVYIAASDHSGIAKYLYQMFRPARVADDSDDANVTPAIGHVADGGFYDYLGVSELFRRKCRLIVVSDAGANLGNNPLGPLAKMCTAATQEFGIKILDLDHESPIDFGRLEIDRSVTNDRVVHQPYLVARLRYADGSEGLLVYCQMAITDSDPIEIQQIRNRFPSFPDEPTTNQFYTNEQVSAYRNLGYHIAKRMCGELQRWDPVDFQGERKRASGTDRQPFFDVVRQRLLTAYRLVCYQERTYKSDDLFSEAIWSDKSAKKPAFSRIAERTLFAHCEHQKSLPESWLRAYEKNADLRAEYRHAVLDDVNSIEDDLTSSCADIWNKILDLIDGGPPINQRELMAAHLATIAVACHEIHEGRPAAIFQVGGRDKLLAMMRELSEVVLVESDDGMFVNTPSNHAMLRAAIKQCIGEILELEKCTFQGSERYTTVSFSQCLVMLWGRLAKKSAADFAQVRRSSFEAIADKISREGVELASSRVKIGVERGLRVKNLSRVLESLEKAWCITYLPAEMIPPPAPPSQPTKKARKKRTAKKTPSRKAKVKTSVGPKDDDDASISDPRPTRRRSPK